MKISKYMLSNCGGDIKVGYELSPWNSFSCWDQGPGDCSTLPCAPGPWAGAQSGLIQPQPILVGWFFWSRLKTLYWNAFRVLPWKTIAGQECFRLCFVHIPFFIADFKQYPPPPCIVSASRWDTHPSSPAPAGTGTSSWTGNHGAASLQSITSATKKQMNLLDPSNLDLG